MGIYPGARRRALASRFIGLFLLLAPALTFGEIGLEYEIRNNPVGVKDRIYLNIFVDHPIPGEVKVENPPLPKEIRITSGPKITRVAVDDTFRTRISYQLRGDDSGRYILKPFLVLVNGVAQETETRILEIGVYRNRRLYMPLDVEWIVPEGGVYVGQSIPVSLYLLDQIEIPLIDDLKVTYPKGAFFEEIQGLAEIESIGAGDRFLYNIPLATYMFTPSQTGRLFLPAAGVTALGESAESATVRIDVKSLPAEARDSGAVGQFIFRSSLSGSRFAYGEVGTLRLEIAGAGNLDYLNIPEPKWGGLVVTDTQTGIELEPGHSGYNGSLRVEYQFISDSAGEYTIVVPDFVFFDVESGSVQNSSGSTYLITYDAPLDGEDDVEPSFPFAWPELITEARIWGAYESPYTYLWLFPAPLAFLVMFILKRSRILFVSLVVLLVAAGDTNIPLCEPVEPAARAYASGDYFTARDLLLDCYGSFEGNAQYAYALALAEYHLGNYDDSMYFARTALRDDPMDARIRDFVLWLNDDLGLEQPVLPTTRIHPDIFLYMMIGLISFAFAAAIAYLVRRNGVYIVLFILGLLLFAGSSAGLSYSARIRSYKTAIVYGHEAEVKKIPSNTGSDWISLPVGYSLKILDETQGFYLVETAYGLAGWMEKNCLVPDKL